MISKYGHILSLKQYLSKCIAMKEYLWKLKNAILSSITRQTIGVRCMIIKDNKVFLVKHSYMPMWYHVGGAIDAKESPINAIKRELMEEAGVSCLADPELYGVYLNNFQNRDDFVIFYTASNITQKAVKCHEIADSGWFGLENLPTDISPATKRRIEEYLGNRTKSDMW